MMRFGENVNRGLDNGIEMCLGPSQIKNYLSKTDFRQQSSKFATVSETPRC